MRPALHVLLFCFIAVLLSPPVFADTPATIVGPDLVPRRVSLQGLGDGAVSYFDAQRKYATEPLSGVVQIRDIGAANESATPAAATSAQPVSIVELIDGQRLVGELADGGGEQSIAWMHPLVGTVVIKLDDLKSITFRGAEAGALTAIDKPEPGDRLLLANGDVVRGFVSRFKDGAMEVKTQAGATVALPIDRIKAVRLANAPRAGRDNTTMVWLDDSSRLRATAVTISGDQLKLTTALSTAAAKAPADTAPVAIPLDKVSRIDFSSPAGRLVALATLPTTTVAGGAAFGLPMAPLAIGDAIALHAPVTVKYELPAGAQRFAAELSLDTSDAAGANPTAWANFDVIARVDGKEAGRWNISGKQPTVTVNIEARGAALTIELEPGVNGPVLDRLKMSNAMLLVK